MEAVFQPPKRRARVYESYEGPLPVPTSQQNVTQPHKLIFKAELVNNRVIVKEPAHIHNLYTKGYFGKGILSRSRPDYSLSDRWKSHGNVHLPVISYARYQTLLQLARDALEAQGLEDEAVDQTLERLTRPVEEFPTPGDDTTGANDTGRTISGDQGDENGHEEPHLSPHDEGHTRSCEGDTMEYHPDPSLKQCSRAQDLRDGTICTTGEPLRDGLGTDREDVDKGEYLQNRFSGAETDLHFGVRTEGQDHDNRFYGEENDYHDGVRTEGDRDGFGRENKGLHSGIDTEQQHLRDRSSDEPEDTPEAKRPRRRQGNPDYDPLAHLHPHEPQQLDQKALAQIRCHRHDDWIVHCGCRLTDSQLEAATPALAREADVEYEYVLVEEEEEDDEEEEDKQRNANASDSKPLVCRINPFRIIEYLQLGLEEAFFLVYALGCLSIYDQQEPLSIVHLWEIFREVQPNFEATYAVYHYFRSKGWVPKTGVKYGSDFMLYRKGPPFYHASYSVVVEKVDEGCRGATLRPFTWRSLAALSRITGNVNKELMLCYVIMPSNLSEEMLSSPECIRDFKVQEVLLSRWVSSRERTDQDEI
ncbi:tRNA-splicing endonuclease subunit Sen2 [Engraulis encrasicolus]|uniref:tRNA-splicing endonuclease subunit Sen2 n=1 Tax=Engraulis encrasicolus TaxID=184585 RepID=UPI002FD15436